MQRSKRGLNITWIVIKDESIFLLGNSPPDQAKLKFLSTKESIVVHKLAMVHYDKNLQNIIRDTTSSRHGPSSITEVGAISELLKLLIATSIARGEMNKLCWIYDGS